MHRKIQIACASLCTVFLAFVLSPARAQQQGTPRTPNPLVQLLESKGILSAADVASIQQAGSARSRQPEAHRHSSAARRHLPDEHDRLTGQATPSVQAAAPAPPAPAPAPAAQPQPSIAAKAQNVQAPPFPTEPGAPSVVERVPSKQINERWRRFAPFPLAA